MDYTVQGDLKESDTTEQLSLHRKTMKWSVKGSSRWVESVGLLITNREQSKANQPYFLESLVSKFNTESLRVSLSSEKNP